MILVVDDEPDILYIIKEGLEKAGFKVATFSSAPKALEHFAANPGKYVLALVDVRMPGISGTDFAARMKAIDPGVGILLMSAFEVAPLDLEKQVAGIDGSIQKPFDLERLVHAVSKYMEGRTRRQPTQNGSG